MIFFADDATDARYTLRHSSRLHELHTYRRTMDDATDPDRTSAHEELVHEFKNHLSVIVGFCDLLLSELPRDDPKRADLEQMHQAGHAAISLLPRLVTRTRRA